MQKYMPSSQFNCYLIIITITIVDRKSTRLNSSHLGISYAVFCLKKKSTRLNSSHLGISYAVFCLKKNITRSKSHRGRYLTADYPVPLGTVIVIRPDLAISYFSQ